jgi:GTP-binding nuclear protein Ran
MANQPTKSIKIVFIGNGGCGKTTYIKMTRTANFESKYIPTMGVEVHPITMDGFVFNCWDCAGQERYGGLQEGYYFGAHTIMICFTVYSKLEVNSIPFWIKMVRDILPDVNIILVGMKNDLYRPVSGLDEIIRKYNLPFCSVSSKSRVGLQLPFQMVMNSMK